MAAFLVGGSLFTTDVVAGPLDNANAYSRTCSGGTHPEALAGYDGSGTLIEGVGAVMNNPQGFDLCGTDSDPSTNFDSTWTAVSSSDGGGYGQSGLLYRFGYSCQQIWAEQSAQNNKFADYYAGCTGDTSSHEYWEQEVAQPGGSYVLRSNSDTDIIHQSSFNPFVAWSEPFSALWSGEAVFATSNIPGSPSNPENFTNAAVQLFSNDQYVGTCGNVQINGYYADDAPSNYHVSLATCNNFKTWSS